MGCLNALKELLENVGTEYIVHALVRSSLRQTEKPRRRDVWFLVNGRLPPVATDGSPPRLEGFASKGIVCRLSPESLLTQFF